jgi:electron transport complex protein RnfG
MTGLWWLTKNEERNAVSFKTNETYFFLGAFLGVTGLLSAALLGVAAALTKEPVAAARAAQTDKALREILPPFDNKPGERPLTFKSSDAEKYDVVFYPAMKDGKYAGAAGISYSNKGYGGKIEVAAGFDAAGAVRSVIVTSHNETPGLGTAVTDRKRTVTIFDFFGGGKSTDKNQTPPNSFLDQFNGRAAPSGGPWKVKKDGGDVSFITGATVSSRAVTDAVSRIAAACAEHKDEIMKKGAE